MGVQSVCVCVCIIIEIASRCEMKRKVIESIEMKIKLNACAHTFIHTRTHRLTHTHATLRESLQHEYSSRTHSYSAIRIHIHKLNLN